MISATYTAQGIASPFHFSISFSTSTLLVTQCLHVWSSYPSIEEDISHLVIFDVLLPRRLRAHRVGRGSPIRNGTPFLATGLLGSSSIPATLRLRILIHCTELVEEVLATIRVLLVF